MPNRLMVRLASLLSVMLILPSFAMAALPTNAEVEAILNKHLIANNKAEGAAVAPVDASGIRVVTAGMVRPGEVVKPDGMKLGDSLSAPHSVMPLASSSNAY